MEIIAPIVAVKRLGGVHLRIECPFCKSRRGRGKPRFHFHGSGGYTGVYIGHRLSHCADYDLPEHLRSREISLGYHLVDIEQAAMSEQDMTNLFSEMNEIADALPAGASFGNDAQIEFRQLQKHHYPDLTREQWLDLFAVWRLQYQAKLTARKAAMGTRMEELVEEHRNLALARSFLPPSAAAIVSERIAAVSQEIAAIYAPPRRPASPLGTWVSSD